MTEVEARKAGLYPTIHYYNHAGRKWMAANHGGHLAALEDEYQGELRNIWDATRGKGTTNLERLATIGQVPLGGRNALDACVYGLGDWAYLASGLVDSDGIGRSLFVHRDLDVDESRYWRRTAVSSVVVVDRYMLLGIFTLERISLYSLNVGESMEGIFGKCRGCESIL